MQLASKDEGVCRASLRRFDGADAAHQHHRMPILQPTLAELLAKVQQPAGLDVEDAQPLGLAAAAVIQVLYVQAARRFVQHAADGPLAAEEHWRVWRWLRAVTSAGRVVGAAGRGVGHRLDVQVEPLGHWDSCVALGVLLELGERERGRARLWRRSGR